MNCLMFFSPWHLPRASFSRTALTACLGLACVAGFPASVPAASSLPARANASGNATAAPSSASGQEASSAARGTAYAVSAQPSSGATTVSAPAPTQPPPAKDGASAQASSPSTADIAQIADTCANCHGPDENHPADGIPSLFGQPAARLRERLHAFRQGQAPDGTVMPRLMKGISEAEIDALADWFAAGGRNAQAAGATR